MAAQDLYELLNVARDAGQDEIKSSYRRLARQYHPDVNKDDPTAEEKFKEISQAYAVLSDPDKRAQYDRFGTVDEMQADPFSGAGGFGDIFEMFFGGMGAAGQTGRRVSGRNGGDIEARVELTLQDVITGLQRELNVNRMVACGECRGSGVEGGGAPDKCEHCDGQGVIMRMQQTFIGAVRTSTTCPVCSGTGTVIKNPCKKCKGRQLVAEPAKVALKIPPGVENGATMHVPGQGHEGTGAGRPGDLYVALNIKPDPRFEREGTELHTRLDVSFAQATLGDEVEIPGVDDTYEVDLSAGTQPGEVFSIRGAGLPPLHGGRRGDLHVHVAVQVPRKLSEEQKQAVLDLATSLGEPAPKGERKEGLLGGLFKKKK